MRVRAAVALVAELVALAGCSVGASASPPSDSTSSIPGPDAPTPTAALVRVAAAADLRFALDDVAVEWSAANPGVTVEPTYGSSGNFLAQISAGAPFDVFFSADAEYPHRLEVAGLADAGSTRLYAIGQIVVWVPAGSGLDVEARGLEALTYTSVETVAIANPEHAPYGRAAVAAIQSAGLYGAIEPKLVLGENVSQAAQFVESGNADAGVIALSMALAPTLRDKGKYSVVPIDSYPRIEQGAVVLKSAASPDVARAFLDFVLGPDGRAVLDRYGFLLPTP